MQYILFISFLKNNYSYGRLFIFGEIYLYLIVNSGTDNMMNSKFDSQFLGTIKTSFKSMDLPIEVKVFIGLIAVGLGLVSLFFIIKKNNIHIEAKNYFFKAAGFLLGGIFPSLKIEDKAHSDGNKYPYECDNKNLCVSSDREVIKNLINRRMQIDISVERSGQRSLAGMAIIIESKGLVLKCRVTRAVSRHLLNPEVTVKCIFLEMKYAERRVNAFVGKVISFNDDNEIALERTSGFGFIRRRANARRKVADQRFIKIKVWRIIPGKYNPGDCLDRLEPDILIDNRKKGEDKIFPEMILDISKGGIAIKAGIKAGGQKFEVNDAVLMAMLMYAPNKKIFVPHLIQGEVRGVRSLGNGRFRLSFQFLRSLKVPPRKRSTLFKGQALMAAVINNPED
jgi:hypothetical protein